ncbi:DUF1292 domain-containing protein [Catenisphaera adipataccumulans]|uniref:UPF0473 protein HNQ47_001192 n=1 Tax=Catenisphaera adipataccumulans TaxID=700500 RepID=A0A7W8CX10_9FIRM|nr:DUF1292 domain-containing protein [Catenisphaera adipataccumulans]MBB5183171.1 uncharacterized protein YrzB (UPF0473 family) [Catenisphaera adipataccumulans]
MLDSNYLYITDDEGNEHKMIILFTFVNEENGNQYVIFQDPEDEDDEVFAARYVEADPENDQGQGDLFEIETEEEWDMIQEVVNTFAEDYEDA